MPQTNTCFGVFPFSEPYSTRFDRIVRPIIETHTGLVYEDARHAYAPEILKIDWIRSKIDEAFLIVADISEMSKPNVFIELGMAYIMRKRVVILCDRQRYRAVHKDGGYESRIPFDLEGKDVLFYDNEKDLKVGLGQFVADAISATQPIKLDWMSLSERNHIKSASELEIFSQHLPSLDDCLIWSTSPISHNFTLSFRATIIDWKQLKDEMDSTGNKFMNPDLRLYLCPCRLKGERIVCLFPWECEIKPERLECHIDYENEPGTSEPIRLQQVEVCQLPKQKPFGFDVFVSFNYPNLVFESTLFEENVSRLVVHRSEFYRRGYAPHLGHYVGFGSPNCRLSIENIRFKEIL